MIKHSRLACLSLAIVVCAPISSHGHGEGPSKPRPAAISGEEHPFGREGDPKKATRTIAMSMHDAMHYSPSTVDLKQGETVTFVVTNKGKLLHEFVLGTEDELKAHAEMMRKHPDMEHDEPYMAHVKPGRTQRITWTFSRPGTFMYGCLVGGHFEAGMKGTIVVAAR